MHGGIKIESAFKNVKGRGLVSINMTFKNIRKHTETLHTVKKACLISNWKKIGIIVDDYDEPFERYKETKECDNCGVDLFGLGRERKCCDHDHDITDKPNFRNILCCYCNLMRG